LAIEGGGLGFVDGFLGVTGMRSDDGGDRGDDAGVFHGRLGLNVRHLTLVAVGAGNVQRSFREMNTCSSWPYLPQAGRPSVTKGAVSRVRAVLNPGFLALLLWDRQINADSSRHDHSESLKNPLHVVQYLSGENVAARIQRERNGTVSLRGKRP
jgi:hypothetical protein